MHIMEKPNVLLIFALILPIIACIDSIPESGTTTGENEGIYTDGEPVQLPYTGENIYKRIGEYTFTLVPVATYQLAAVIICIHSYAADEVDELTPVDLCVVWGRMADPAYIHSFTCEQRDRGCYLTAEESPFDDAYVDTHFTNIHVIPANTTILKTIQSVTVNQALYLEGFLVNVYCNGVQIWETSLTRKDTGDNSCEVLYVTAVKIGK
jgi:hypothetical protein